MFLPLRDALPTGRLPLVTLVLIALNVLVWLVGFMPAEQQAIGSNRQVSRHDVWLVEYGAIPCELTGRCENQNAIVVVDGGVLDPQPREVTAQVDAHAPVLTLVTSLFLHGGMFHLFINMLFLGVYGRNVEYAMGSLTFLGFYLLAGIASGVAQALVSMSATSPTIGASGAIAAVIGAYLFLYPRSRVQTLVFPPFVVWLPAWAVAGTWGAIQLLATWQSLLVPAALDGGGVAYVAHVTGFVLGFATAGFFAQRRNPRYQEQLDEAEALAEDAPETPDA